MAVTGRATARRATILEDLFGSAQALDEAEHELQHMLRERGIYFGEDVLPTYAFAFVANRTQIDRWAAQAELLIAAAEHVTSEVMSDLSSCDTQIYDSSSNELIYAYPGYSKACVICRPDGIICGDDVKFVELNCDSPAMMMFLDIVTQCVLQLDAMRSVRERTHVISAADRLLDSLLGCYREYGGGDSPTIAITDWEGQKTRFEHQRLAEHFAARGCPTVVCDPRALRRVDGHLELEDGRKIDLIYRRALATEMISRRSEIEPLLGAYRDGKVCMVNPLRSYVASAKSLLIRLQDRDLPMALKAASHVVPRTLLLTDPDVRKAVMSAPKRYVLKKSESHGGKHVVLPGVSSDGAWREAIEASRRDIWIAQDYVDVPTMQLPVANGERVEWIERYFNWNPFVFGGRYAGGLVRTSTTPLINITQGGGLLPTLGT